MKAPKFFIVLAFLMFFLSSLHPQYQIKSRKNVNKQSQKIVPQHFQIIPTEKKRNLKSDTIVLQQKIAQKTKLMNRWRSILPIMVENNPLNRILIPLYMERIEQSLDKFPGEKTYVRFRKGKREEVSVNVREQFKALVDAYKDLPITVKRRYIHFFPHS